MDKQLLRPFTKRRLKHPKPGTLSAYYARHPDEGCDVVLHNELPALRCDAHYLHSVLNCPRYNYKGEEEPSVVEELVTRGYDVTTLNFSIKMKESG